MGSSNLEILAYESSPIGMICLRQRELLSEPGTVVTEITVDHHFLMSSHNTVSERALAHRALDMHEGEALNVLIGGFGLGYTAREVLVSDRVARLEAVELLPQVIGWFEQGLIPLSAELRAESRFSLVEGDVYARFCRPPMERYDLILIDVDHSPEERLGDTSDSFYTEAGLKRAKRHLATDGVLGVWSYSESPTFAEVLRRVFGEVRLEPVTFRNPVVDEEETNWLFFGRG